MPPVSPTPKGTSLRSRVPEKNSQLVAMAERADRLMEKRRTSRIPVSLADLEDLKNLVHEAAELGHKARFLWLSADERADELGRQLFDTTAELAAVRKERDRYHAAWHNARTRAADGWADAEFVAADGGAA